MAGLRDMPGCSHEGKVCIIPVDWGNTALTYRTDKVPDADVTSLQVFADPKYRGRISIVDNVDGAYALGFLATGGEGLDQGDRRRSRESLGVPAKGAQESAHLLENISGSISRTPGPKSTASAPASRPGTRCSPIRPCAKR